MSVPKLYPLLFEYSKYILKKEGIVLNVKTFAFKPELLFIYYCRLSNKYGRDCLPSFLPKTNGASYWFPIYLANIGDYEMTV